MGVAALFLLSSLCLFADTSQAQQCSKPSGGPNMDLKPAYILNTTFADGATVAFSCSPGYTSAGGSPTIKCTAGQWSAVLLRCERKTCNALPEVDNGEVIYTDGNEFGDTARVQCKPGYNPVGDHQYSDVTSRDGRAGCKLVKCVTPGGIVNGTFSQMKEFYEYREVVRYSCSKDLVLNGSRELTCSDDGISPLPLQPVSVGVECKDPVIENGQYESGSRPPHRHQAAVTYSCKTGYKMEGPSTVTCNLTSQWSPSLPKCNMVKCVTPGGIVNGTFSPVRDSYDYKDVVQYSCSKGLVLNGSGELTCSDDGNFSPAPPTCVWVECKDPVIENGQYESGSRPPHRHKAVVTYSCKPGYTMDGPSTVTCSLTSQWFPSLPKCKKNPTTPITTTVSSTTATTTTTPSGHGIPFHQGLLL